ncbi:MAG: hypothetical protein AB1449_05305 [Chloroflexota bacterium]
MRSEHRVHDRPRGQRFTSRILPPYMRRSLRLGEALPVLSLRGLLTGDFQEALPVLLGPEASGLSAWSINRLMRTWQDEYRPSPRAPGRQGYRLRLG